MEINVLAYLACMLLAILFLILCGAIGYFLFTGLFDFFTGGAGKPERYVDRSVHYHDNRSIHYHLPDGEPATIRKANERTIREPE